MLGRRVWQVLGALTVLAAGLAGPIAAPADAAPRPCRSRVLVLSAFPAELDAVLAKAGVRARRHVVTGGRTFYRARLAGHDALVALTGIGPVNARATIEAAIAGFRCGTASAISAVVFSGVAGSRHYIGDVTVPQRWTDDGGRSWFPVDAAMLAKAAPLAGRAAVALERDNPLPAAPCPCDALDQVRTVHIPHAPEVLVGGDGATTDPLGGRALPCAPFGGDVFGCRICRARGGPPGDVPGFLTGIVPFLDPDFIASYLAAPEASSTPIAAADNETATVGRVATDHGIPFIGFRGVSDGAGDPLMLPGFPVQFFAYYRLAANNAAAVTLAFLAAWPPTAPS